MAYYYDILCLFVVYADIFLIITLLRCVMRRIRVFRKRVKENPQAL